MRAKNIQRVMVPTEEQEQMALFEWADANLHVYPELAWLHAIHNGLRLSVGMRSKAKKLGTRKGVADVFLPVSRRGCHGMYIELKRQKGGVVSDEQNAFGSFVMKNGYLWEVARGYEQAIRLLKFYLNLSP